MAIHFTKKTIPVAPPVKIKPSVEVNPPAPRARRNGNTRPRAPLIALDQPGRLRVGHLLALLGVTASTFYERKHAGIYPEPDGKEGRFPYWNTGTVKTFLDGGAK